LSQTSLTSLQEQYDTLVSTLDKNDSETKRLKIEITNIERSKQKTNAEYDQLKKSRDLSETQVQAIKMKLGSSSQCPVIQDNNEIVPLEAVINQWVTSPSEELSSTRYICPNLNEDTRLASYQSIQMVREFAGIVGIDVNPPIKFLDASTKKDLDFKDQLNLIAALCLVVKTHKTTMVTVKLSAITFEYLEVSVFTSVRFTTL
jgi:hypothetical protein